MLKRPAPLGSSYVGAMFVLTLTEAIFEAFADRFSNNELIHGRFKAVFGFRASSLLNPKP